MAAQHLALARPPQPAAAACWLCRIHLSATELVADGGSGCADVRYYCRDVQGCTERWTTRTPKSASDRSSGILATPVAAQA
jgi:hypothetical protein